MNHNLRFLTNTSLEKKFGLSPSLLFSVSSYRSNQSGRFSMNNYKLFFLILNLYLKMILIFQFKVKIQNHKIKYKKTTELGLKVPYLAIMKK